MLTTEWDKRNEHNTNFNRGVNIIHVIDNCLGVTAIGLGITGVGLLSRIVAATAVIGMEQYQLLGDYFAFWETERLKSCCWK